MAPNVAPFPVSSSDRRLVDEYGDGLDLLPAVDKVQVRDVEPLQTLQAVRVAILTWRRTEKSSSDLVKPGGTRGGTG